MLRIYFLTNFDTVVQSAYLVNALCGTPKYFDGASSLVWDLKILIDITNSCHSELLTYTEPPEGQVNWPPETSIFASFLKNILDEFWNSCPQCLDALRGTPKYFDGASSLIRDLRAQYQNWRSPGTLCVYVYRVFCQKQCSVSFPPSLTPILHILCKRIKPFWKWIIQFE